MTAEIIIGTTVAMVVAVILGIKVLAHRVLSFKMDESAILNFLKESSGELKFYSSEVISSGTNLSANRVSLVCSKSKLIQRNTNQETWCLVVTSYD